MERTLALMVTSGHFHAETRGQVASQSYALLCYGTRALHGKGLAETRVLGQDWVGRLSEADTLHLHRAGLWPWGGLGLLGCPVGLMLSVAEHRPGAAPRTRHQLPGVPHGERPQPGACRGTWRECGETPCPGWPVQAQSAPPPCWTPGAAAACPSSLHPWSLAAHPSLSPAEVPRGLLPED